MPDHRGGPAAASALPLDRSLGKYLNEYPFVDSAPRHAVRPTLRPTRLVRLGGPGAVVKFHGVGYDINV